MRPDLTKGGAFHDYAPEYADRASTSGTPGPLAPGRFERRPGQQRHPDSGQFVAPEDIAAGHPDLSQQPGSQLAGQDRAHPDPMTRPLVPNPEPATPDREPDVPPWTADDDDPADPAETGRSDESEVAAAADDAGPAALDEEPDFPFDRVPVVLRWDRHGCGARYVNDEAR